MALTLKELMNTPFQKEISEGKHTAVLSTWQYVEDKHQNPENDYIAMTFVIDNDCTYKRNMFARDISIMLSHVRRQLNRSNETLQPMSFLENLVKDKTVLNIWFSYPTVLTKNGYQRTQNIKFIEPIQAPVEAANDDSAELAAIAG